MHNLALFFAFKAKKKSSFFVVSNHQLILDPRFNNRINLMVIKEAYLYLYFFSFFGIKKKRVYMNGTNHPQQQIQKLPSGLDKFSSW